MKIKIDNLDDTRRLAVSTAAALPPGALLLLSGDLGSGKTTFVRFLACALGFPEENVSSPSFTIVQKYTSRDGRTFYHIDLFRIEQERELISLGMEELFEEECLVAVEWPGIAAPLFRASGKPVVEFDFVINRGEREVDTGAFSL